LVATIFFCAALLPGILAAEDWTAQDRQWAQTWAMHRIAVIQAAEGDAQAAKRTVSQIDEFGAPGDINVTAVWFVQGQPVYQAVPACYGDCRAAAESAATASPGWAARDAHAVQYFWAQDRGTDRVPTQVPPGLPTNYLDPDPRHGAVVDFVDEVDVHGTRVTSRAYADGYAVIETPAVSAGAERK
jgi:hypothetical protein